MTERNLQQNQGEGGVCHDQLGVMAGREPEVNNKLPYLYALPKKNILNLDTYF